MRIKSVVVSHMHFKLQKKQSLVLDVYPHHLNEQIDLWKLFTNLKK